MELNQELSQEEIFQKELKTVKFQLQEINDNLSGGLTSRNLTSFRNTYVINAQDSLDASYPMYVHFNIIDEMIKIVSVKVDFWILNYRAYSTAAASGGEETSGIYDTGEGGYINVEEVDDFIKLDVVGDTYRILDANAVDTLDTHTHTTPNHTHDLTYGIFEEDTSPTIKFYVSENAGVSYSDVFGGYTIDKSGLDITSLLTESGSKLIKFTSDVRARLSVQIEIKLDIKAR